MANKGDKNKTIEYRKAVGERLTEFRKSLKMNQMQFAELIGKSVAMVGRYERGEAPIPDEVKDLLHRENGLKCDYLISGDKIQGINLLEVEAHIEKVGSEHLLVYMSKASEELLRRQVKD